MARSWSPLDDNTRGIWRPSLNMTERFAVPPQVWKPPSHHPKETSDERHAPLRADPEGPGRAAPHRPATDRSGPRAGAGLGPGVRYLPQRPQEHLVTDM